MLRNLAVACSRHKNRYITQAAVLNNYHTSATNSARVLCTDNVDESCVSIFKERGHQVDFLKTMPEDELCKIIGDYDGLVVRSATKVTPEVIKHMRKMRVIGRAGVGIDNINVKEATQKGIMVMNTPGGNTISTAQLAMAHLASLSRYIPQADASIKEGKWDKKAVPSKGMGIELFGKTLGIVGCGRIGQVVANGAKAIGMKVIGYDPVMSAKQFQDVGIDQVDLDGIFSKSDFITFHTPLTSATKDLMNDETLLKCKKGVRLINCARGGIVNEAALLRALESGQVAGAALDVFTTEPPSKDAELAGLLAHPNLICTPHLGASTDEAQLNVAKDIAVQMSDAFDEQQGLGLGDYYFSVVNASYLAAQSTPGMAPFVELSEHIGSIQAQLLMNQSDSPIASITMKTFGAREVNITNAKTRQLLQASLLKGILKPYLGSAANTELSSLSPDLISSPSIANDLKIATSISNDTPVMSNSAAFWNLIGVEMKLEDGTTGAVTGTVFGTTPYIVKVDDMETTLKPSGGNCILTFKNEDRPGAIGEVLSILALHKVNVATLVLGRNNKDAADTQARCFIHLDDDCSLNTMESLKQSSGLSNVAKITLR